MTRRLLSPATLCLFSLLLTACGGGSGSPGPASTETPPPVSEAAFTCPASETAFGAQRATAPSATAGYRRFRPGAGSADPSLLEVAYDPQPSVSANLDAKIAQVYGKSVSDHTFDRARGSFRVVYVDPANRDAIAASLRSVRGVKSVTPVQRYHTLAVSTPFITNDPIFAGTGVPKLYENATGNGQWDMHVIGLENAFAYSKSTNGSGFSNANALGSRSIRLAVIDTGTDVTHTDLADGAIVETKCFITDTNGNQSTGSFVTDPDGHGTNVSGIAGAAVNDGFGFAGAAGNVSLMLYRVFPTPDSACATKTSTPLPECSATGSDIAAAIDDARQNGANVINLSFGGSLCNGGQDPDPLQGAAIARAIAANIVVVAASGNDSTQNGVGAPACDPGVIAVGATGWNDGLPNGTNFVSATRKEYVAGYSQYGSTNVLRSATAWGIVAPGGDASSAGGAGTDTDDLHWIDNIWTSTPFDSSDRAYQCTDGFGEANCYEYIDGTSMSAPHVAGAAALLLSVAPRFQSPSAMLNLLCSTADDIGDAHQGCGRLNVYRAMAVAVGDPNLP